MHSLALQRLSRYASPPKKKSGGYEADARQDDYTACAETHATLRLLADDLDPDDVTRRLGITPTDSFLRGDPHGRGVSDHRHSSGGWLRDTSASVSKDAQRHVVELLNLLEPVATEYRAMRQDGVDADVFVYWEKSTGAGGGPWLDPATMARLSALDLPIMFDIY